MTTDADRRRTEFIFDPSAVHCSRRWLQLERLLIKFSRAFLVGNGDGDECDFVRDHGQGSFSFSGLSLWMMILLPSGSLITAMRQHGLSNGSASNGTCRSFNRLIASSKFSTSSAALVPSSAGFH